MKYIPTIGLEVHVQLNTNTKIFCSCETSFGDSPNSHTCPVCLGLPGALPVFNETVLRKAMSAALAVKAQVHHRFKFDRKNYFYPDLPKAYQISQFDMPYCTGGFIEIEKPDKTTKKIHLTRIHMEEDAGKLMHSEDPMVPESYVDLNRAGTPLIEIVSEPEIDSSEEAYLYLNKLKNIMEYIDVSDCNMEQGSLRCDANVSVRPEGQKEFGTRAEIKNLNSFKAVRAAIDYEIERQIDILESGGSIAQETRLWNATLNQTFSMRGKEEAHDYRYFPEPDLPPFEISDAQIQKVREELPELADQKKARFIKEYGLPEYDAGVLTANRAVSEYFEEAVALKAPPKKISNWIMVEMLAVTGERDCSLSDLFPAKHLAELVNEIESGHISGKIGKKVFQEMIESDKSPSAIIEEQGLAQITDTSAIEAFVDEVIRENPESVESVKQGKDRVLGFLVGQVMKKSKGKANPPMVNQLLKEKIDAL